MINSKKEKANNDIREAARKSGVFLYQIAKKLDISDSGFIVKLRYELSEADKEQVFNAIENIRAEQEAGEAV